MKYLQRKTAILKNYKDRPAGMGYRIWNIGGPIQLEGDHFLK